LGRVLGKQPVEPFLDGAGDAFELCEKGHLGESVRNSGSLPQMLGNPYPNTTLLKAATGRYKAAYGDSGGLRRADKETQQATS
jgi:hypothetical protein